MTVSKAYTWCINAGQLIVGINCNSLITSTFKVWHSIAFQIEGKQISQLLILNMYHLQKNLTEKKAAFWPYFILLSLLMLMTGVLSLLNEKIVSGVKDKCCTCNKAEEDLFFNQLLILKIN